MHCRSWHLSCYSATQVEAAAHAKHGGAEGIEQHRTQQMEGKVQRRAAKRKEDARKASTHPAVLVRICWLSSKMHFLIHVC